MRILIANTFYFPNMKGGAEHSVKLLAESLVKKGHTVAVYCVDSQNGVSKEMWNDVCVYRRNTNKFNLYKYSYDKKAVGKVEKIVQKFYALYNVKCAKDFADICREFAPDIVHTNTIYGMSFLVWREAAKLNIPLVHTVRDTAIVSPVSFGKKTNPIVNTVYHIYVNKMSDYVDAVSAPSNYTLYQSLKTGAFRNAKIKECIVNSIVIDRDEIIRNIEKKRERTDEKIIFLYAGRLIWEKGITHMLEAFARLNNQNCMLKICGDGPLREDILIAAQKDSRIEYCGNLSADKLKVMYIECDVVLVPSVWNEPFGRVVIEGNVYGSPVIACRSGGIPEIIVQTKAGELYDSGDSEQLCRLLEKFSHREKIRKYYNAILQNINYYSIERQIVDFEKIYEEVRR